MSDSDRIPSGASKRSTQPFCSAMLRPLSGGCQRDLRDFRARSKTAACRRRPVCGTGGSRTRGLAHQRRGAGDYVGPGRPVCEI